MEPPDTVDRPKGPSRRIALRFRLPTEQSLGATLFSVYSVPFRLFRTLSSPFRVYTPDRQSSLPVLSPNFSTGTPALSSMLSNKLLSGVSLGNLRWRLPLTWPAPPPARTIGRSW